MVYFGKNVRPFTAINNCNFGRTVITTNKVVNASNIVEELNRTLPIHRANANEIEYLDRYYRGDQPILYRDKQVRPEINNKVVVNLAHMLVETKTSEIAGEPIQYVLRGIDEAKSEEIARLNAIMVGEDKDFFDISLCRWRSICGTSYRYVGKDDSKGQLLDEADFFITSENPMTTYVVYDVYGRPSYSVQIRRDDNNEEIYIVYTKSQYFKIKGDQILDIQLNGNKDIPVIEYPNNERRISDIELTIAITDEINRLASDRANGIEQFIASFIKFVNCDIDKKLYEQMRQEGVLVVKSNNGSENKADVDVLTQELNQTQAQVAVSDLYEKFLVVQGLASRQGNTGGDTQGAVELRNGHYDSEKRAELSEPIFKRSERAFLRIILNRLRIKQGITLLPSDVEIKISRTKMDNMLVKAETLEILLRSGIEGERAIKTIGLFPDPEQVAIESADRLKFLYPTEVTSDEGRVEDSRATE